MRARLMLQPTYGRFAPTEFADLALWLDALTLPTLFQDTAFTIPVVSAGDVVGGWQDKSGNGNHAIQATVAQKPTYRVSAINGKPGLRSDGVDDHIDSSSVVADFAADFTMFIVAEQPTGANNKTFCSSAAFRFQTSEMNLSVVASQANYAAVATPQIMTVTHDAGVLLEAFRDGVSVGTDSTIGAPASGVDLQLMRDELSGIGGVDEYPGDISEFIIYERVVSVLERQQVEAYLSSKWSIALS